MQCPGCLNTDESFFYKGRWGRGGIAGRCKGRKQGIHAEVSADESAERSIGAVCGIVQDNGCAAVIVFLNRRFMVMYGDLETYKYLKSP